ncbi:glycine--tRNA ligase subunit beta [Thermodesulfobacteriota bacterium]
MAAELLLEIGTEEIPAGYLANGLENLRRMAEDVFKDCRIDISGNVYVYGTPRRLVLIIEEISEKQHDLLQEMTGPPKNVAYDKEGNPTKAAIGFAKKQGISIEDVSFIDTPKGEYLYVKKQVAGRPTKEILAEVLPKLIADLPWPKSMRWGSVNFSFVRPIHWVLALFGGEIVSFEVGGVFSGDRTFGHRFMSPESIRIAGAKDYLEKIKNASVVVDQSERELIIERMIAEESEKVGGTAADDQALIKTVANLAEYPSAVCGNFDNRFLELPDSVLVTAMREHQKYFAIYDKKKKLMPNFIAVNNTLARDDSIVRKGHERVLRARLSDAQFFFNEDMKRPIEDRLEDLKGVIYQADLGTSYEKVMRFTQIAEYLCEIVLPDSIELVRTAAKLCKCDLVTLMVNEFPSLQGVMGMEYAKAEDFPKVVCSAIYEHYLPTRSGGPVPESEIGSIVGCADRMDTIVGCFAVGLEPTGSADPFALRRHSLAILSILEEKGWEISLSRLVAKGISVLAESIHFDEELVHKKVMDFLRERYKNKMLIKGYETGLIDAVISVNFDKLNLLNQKIDQLKEFASGSEEFQALTQTFKRVSNILKKQDRSFEVNEDLFQESCETDLWKLYQGLSKELSNSLEDGDFSKSLRLLTRLRKPVDELFEGVEILSRENEWLKRNRLGMLQHIEGLFLNVADLSRISV